MNHPVQETHVVRSDTILHFFVVIVTVEMLFRQFLFRIFLGSVVSCVQFIKEPSIFPMNISFQLTFDLFSPFFKPLEVSLLILLFFISSRSERI